MGGGPQGEDVPIHIADSLGCTSKTSTTLKSNCTPIQKISYSAEFAFKVMNSAFSYVLSQVFSYQ